MLAILVGVIAIGVIGVLVAYPVGSKPAMRELKIEAWDFGFNGPSGGPVQRLKAGETVRITLVSKAGTDHQLMVIRDKDAFLLEVNKTISSLAAKGLEQDDVEDATEYLSTLRAGSVGKLIVDGKQDIGVKVKPEETKTFTLTIDQPGTYWYLCTELDVTYPKIHADRGMLGQVIVEP